MSDFLLRYTPAKRTKGALIAYRDQLFSTEEQFREYLLTVKKFSNNVVTQICNKVKDVDQDTFETRCKTSGLTDKLNTLLGKKTTTTDTTTAATTTTTKTKTKRTTKKSTATTKKRTTTRKRKTTTTTA